MFLPITKEDMKKRKWNQVDFVLVTGDPYVDHHSFGTAIISRLLERYGYKVAILARPDFKSANDFKRFGRPRLGFLVNGGSVDSMVNNYSVFKRKRKVDKYDPKGETGRRPDRAVIVYANRAKEAYKDVPIIIGGLEASLRRFAHYDYWDDKIRRSILLDSRADLLIYGMGEKAILEIAEALDSGLDIGEITWVKGTSFVAKSLDNLDKETIKLPSFTDIINSKKKYAESFKIQSDNNDHITAKPLVEEYTDTVYVVQNSPQEPLSSQELDDIYELPFENESHPVYDEFGGIPAFQEVKFSIVSCRGCFGNCRFCALNYHQGRQVRARSVKSIVKEATELTKKKDFKGYIHDLGGPSANFMGPACQKQLKAGVCKDKDCLYPNPCNQLIYYHDLYLEALNAVRKIPKVKKVFVRSGIRYDYLLADKKHRENFIDALVKNHVSGTLKVAPEHVSKNVLSYMGKPGINVFLEFSDKYKKSNEKNKMNQYLIPYMISSHPGSTLEDAIELALFLKEYGFVPDQVQDFYPTPGTMSTCMFYTGIDPRDMKPMHVPKDLEEKKMQRALLQFNKEENARLVKKALIKAGRQDLLNVLKCTRRGKGKKEITKAI